MLLGASYFENTHVFLELLLSILDKKFMSPADCSVTAAGLWRKGCVCGERVGVKTRISSCSWCVCHGVSLVVLSSPC